MGLFNWFGETEHRVFNYKPRYYDPKKEELKKKFGDVDGSNAKDDYAPGTYLKGAFRDGHYSKEKSHASKAQNIIGLIGLILVVTILIYIAKFYSLL